MRNDLPQRPAAMSGCVQGVGDEENRARRAEAGAVRGGAQLAVCGVQEPGGRAPRVLEDPAERGAGAAGRGGGRTQSTPMVPRGCLSAKGGKCMFERPSSPCP